MEDLTQLESLNLSPVHIVHVLSKLDPVSGLRYLIHIRSIKYGFGIKDWFRSGLLYMANIHPEVVSNNLQSIVDFGCWRDLYILMNTTIESSVVKLFAKQLTTDLHTLHREQDKLLSLAAKWVLREKSQLNKRTNFRSKLCTQLDVSEEILRKTYLTPIRAALCITESLMCANKWDCIDYSRVPRECLRINCKHFLRHDPQRFSEYIISTNTGYSDSRDFYNKTTDMYSLGMIPSRLPRVLEQYQTSPDTDRKLYILGDTSGSCKLNSTIEVIYQVLRLDTSTKWISWTDCTKISTIADINVKDFLELQVSGLETNLSTAVETILSDTTGQAILYIMTDTELESTFCQYKEFLANIELQSRLQLENRLQIVHWNCNYKYVEILPLTNSYFRCIRGRDEYLVKAVASKHTNLASKYIREISLALSYLRINSRRQFTLNISHVTPLLVPLVTP